MWKTAAWTLAALGCLATAQTARPEGPGPAGSQPASGPAAETVLRLTAGGPLVPLVQSVTGGGMDWTAGCVEARGTGQAAGATAQDAAMAKRAAYVQAVRNALLAAKGIPIGPGGKFANLPQAVVKVEGAVQGFQEVASEFDPRTGKATCTVRVPLHGTWGLVEACGLAFQGAPARWEWPAGEANATAPAIVIDMRGTAFAPALLPRLVTAEGQCVFDASELGEAQLKRRPPVAYVAYKGPGAATAPAVGAAADAPLVQALAQSLGRAIVLHNCAAAKDSPGRIVLSAASVQYFRAHPASRQALLEGRWVIVTSAP